MLEVLWTKISGDGQQASTSKILTPGESKTDKTSSESKDSARDSAKDFGKDSKESTVATGSSRNSPCSNEEKVNLYFSFQNFSKLTVFAFFQSCRWLFCFSRKIFPSFRKVVGERNPIPLSDLFRRMTDWEVNCRLPC